MTDTMQQSAAPIDIPTETITVDEMIERHRGEWILMRVAAYDEDGWPTRGLLLDYSPTKEGSIAALRRWFTALTHEGGPFYLRRAVGSVGARIRGSGRRIRNRFDPRRGRI
jgi:hypothetical protein